MQLMIQSSLKIYAQFYVYFHSLYTTKFNHWIIFTNKR